MENLYTIFERKFEDANSCHVCLKWDIPGLMYIHDMNRKDDPMNHVNCKTIICIACFLQLPKGESPYDSRYKHVVCPSCRGVPFLSPLETCKSKSREMAYRIYHFLQLHDTEERSLFNDNGDDFDYIRNSNVYMEYESNAITGNIRTVSILWLEIVSDGKKVASYKGSLDQLVNSYIVHSDYETSIDMLNSLGRNIWNVFGNIIEIRPFWYNVLIHPLQELFATRAADVHPL